MLEMNQKSIKNKSKAIEREEHLLKKYNVKLTAHCEKTFAVHAENPEQAAEKVSTILFDTDLITFSEEDFVTGEVDITKASAKEERGMEETEEADEEEEHEPGTDDPDDDCCLDCPNHCPVCGACTYEGEC